MRRFPFVKLSDPLFLVSCGMFFSYERLCRFVLTNIAVLVLLNHYVWFRHFHHTQQSAYSNMSSFYDQPDIPTFTEIASYFGLCVWLIPFALFVSLSASDNVLPTMGSEEPERDPHSKNRRQGMVKALVDNLRDAIGEIIRMTGRDRP
jgi:MFS superfamily sulfate permease-like transporter